MRWPKAKAAVTGALASTVGPSGDLTSSGSPLDWLADSGCRTNSSPGECECGATR